MNPNTSKFTIHSIILKLRNLKNQNKSREIHTGQIRTPNTE